jgi:hypothetical protein
MITSPISWKDRIDVAIRNGRLDDRNIIARQLAPMQLIVCGSAKILCAPSQAADAG